MLIWRDMVGFEGMCGWKGEESLVATSNEEEAMTSWGRG